METANRHTGCSGDEDGGRRGGGGTLHAYHRFRYGVVITVDGAGGGAAGSQIPPLRQALLSLRLPNLDLLLLAAASQLVGLEGLLGLVVAPVFGDVSFSHGAKRVLRR